MTISGGSEESSRPLRTDASNRSHPIRAGRSLVGLALQLLVVTFVVMASAVAFVSSTDPATQLVSALVGATATAVVVIAHLALLLMDSSPLFAEETTAHDSGQDG